jgi:hypothetical protein
VEFFLNALTNMHMTKGLVLQSAMKKKVGYALLVLSFVPWGMIALLPFLELSAGQIAAATTALIIAGECLFYISIVLLGREAWQKIKSLVTFKR